MLYGLAMTKYHSRRAICHKIGFRRSLERLDWSSRLLCG